jgi:hypothetical protein
MAAIIDIPQLRVRSRVLHRVRAALAAVDGMPQGGTAADVRDLMLAAGEESVSVDSVKIYLWHLHELGLVDFELVGNCRWWQRTNSERK